VILELSTEEETFASERRDKEDEYSSKHTSIFPSIASLLNPKSLSSPSTATDHISEGIGKHGRFMSVPRLSEKIAMMYNMCLYIRWLRNRTKANWLAMPKHLRPTKLQQTVPHPAWIDMVIWPCARDAIIEQMDWSQFELYRTASGAELSVHWPQPEQVVVMNGNEVALTPAFERHIRNIDNWSSGKGVARIFPFLSFLPE